MNKVNDQESTVMIEKRETIWWHLSTEVFPFYHFLSFFLISFFSRDFFYSLHLFLPLYSSNWLKFYVLFLSESNSIESWRRKNRIKVYWRPICWGQSYDTFRTRTAYVKILKERIDRYLFPKTSLLSRKKKLTHETLFQKDHETCLYINQIGLTGTKATVSSSWLCGTYKNIFSDFSSHTYSFVSSDDLASVTPPLLHIHSSCHDSHIIHFIHTFPATHTHTVTERIWRSEQADSLLSRR